MDELSMQKYAYELKLEDATKEIELLKNKIRNYRNTLFEINRYANGDKKTSDKDSLESISDLACNAISEKW